MGELPWQLSYGPCIKLPFVLFQGADFIDPKSSPRTDENGHGTHVAGTVMSFGYGIATRATAIAVRVLDKNGSGSTTGVIDGIEWAVEAATTTYSDIVGIIK